MTIWPFLASLDVAAAFERYGPKFFPYLVFGFAIVENDVTFLVAGIYASSVTPHIHPMLAVGCGLLGALCHDSFWFGLGRNRSDWLKQTSAWKKMGPQIEAWAERFGVRELFLARFIPGTRNVSILFWGIQRLHYSIFLAVETLAISLWGTLLVFTGYFLGAQAKEMLFEVKEKHLGRKMLMILLVTLVIYWCIRAFTRHEIVKHGKPPEDPRAD